MSTFTMIGGKSASEIAEEVLGEVWNDIAEREQKIRDRGVEMNFGIVRHRDSIRVSANRIAPDAPWELTASVVLWHRQQFARLESVSEEYPT